MLLNCARCAIICSTVLPASKISESPFGDQRHGGAGDAVFLGVDMGFTVDRLIAVVAAEYYAAVGG